MQNVNNQPLTIKAASFSLLAALLVYPFTIAGTNLFLALLLITSLFSLDLMKYGWSICWHHYKPITIGILLIIGFNFIGSLWGPINDLAFHKMGKQINWLLIPIIIGLVYFKPSLRKHAFIWLSMGMFLHLIVCTLQYQGLLSIQGLGSHKDDATGFVGHLSFGFIYGIWAGALLVAAQSMTTIWRYICYALALYAVVTIFMAQGRSGYITTFACLTLVVFKVLYPGKWKHKLIALGVVITALSLFIATHPSTQNKLKDTVAGVHAVIDGNWHSADLRLKIWVVSWEIWKENPWFGVGTSGYPDAARKALAQGLKGDLEIRSDEEFVFYGHPHHEFLFALSRWGPLGLLALTFLCFHWIRTGWRKDWEHDTMNAYLVTASGISVVLHGLTEPSLNTRLETVFAIIVLAFGLSQNKAQKQT